MNGAHLHLLLNHIPVLGAAASLGLILLGFLKKERVLLNLSFQVMILIGLLCLPAYFTGEPAEEVIEHLPGFSESLVEAHENQALFSLLSTELLALMGIFGFFKFRKNAQISGNFEKNFYKATLLVALINTGLMAATANFGGKIRHTEIRVERELSAPSHDE